MRKRWRSAITSARLAPEPHDRIFAVLHPALPMPARCSMPRPSRISRRRAARQHQHASVCRLASMISSARLKLMPSANSSRTPPLPPRASARSRAPGGVCHRCFGHHYTRLPVQDSHVPHDIDKIVAEHQLLDGKRVICSELRRKPDARVSRSRVIPHELQRRDQPRILHPGVGISE
jgi:hypothetical protein